MTKVDRYFQQKYERRRNMTVQEIKEEKQKKFLQRQKESLFRLVDNIDLLKKGTKLLKSGSDVTEDPNASTSNLEET